MHAVIDHKWNQIVYPKLTIQQCRDLLNLLISYVPKVEVKFERFDSAAHLAKGRTWCFPFVDIPDAFDHGDYECWVELCEEEIAAKYKLPMSCFEC